MKTETRWTIDELCSEVVLVLADGYDGAPNGRVRELPDLRTIRYYTTLGLIDRPAEMRGRTALYGMRHLRQIVAIKRLQAKGLTLTQIQERLLGVTDAELRRLAAVSERAQARLEPPTVAGRSERMPRGTSRGLAPRQRAPSDTSPAAAGSVAEPRSSCFWKVAPASAVTPNGASGTSLGAAGTAARVEAAGAEGPTAGSTRAAPSSAVGMYAIELGESALLVLGSRRLADEDDIEAIRAAAGPLLKLLAKRRLTQPRHERENQ